ncbi:hypothetical protein [Rhodococcus opacus]|uniref:hypothetical protein n=1 Tax=Rhodococcus opacus TaxID=37919 RepID=UPI0024755DF6|nr:hypothetical protein [Rhodococcus opacus]MDH6292819.1 hypothetical protein [Rhodococcus opacus]
MTAEMKTTEQPEVHWDTVVLHQSKPRRSHLLHGAGSTLGLVTAIGAISAAVLALTLVVGGVGSALLHLVWGPSTRHVRKRQPAQITGAQLEQAPDELRQLMSDAVLAVKEIKGSRGFRDGMFTDLDLRAAMWDLGARVLAVTELHEAITAAAGADREVLTLGDHQTYTRARTQIEQVVQALREAATTVADLDTELAAAEDAARAADERGRQLAESSTRVDRLAHAHTAVAATTATAATTVTDLTETISTRAHTYRNLPRP